MSNLIDKRNRIRQAVPHIATASGSIASFQTDMRANLEEIKIHFNPQQAAGTPSPTNVLPITGWTGCDLWRTGKNVAHQVGWSAKSINSPTGARSLSNNYGTTLNTTDPSNTLVVTQSEAPNPTLSDYRNGYFAYIDDNLKFGATYKISFRVTNIISNPLNASISDIVVYGPRGSLGDSINKSVSGDKFSVEITYREYPVPTRHLFEIRNCGMSCTISDFMVTPVSDTDTTFAPFVGNQIPVSWSSLGTVYGGWVNPINGELWADRICEEPNDNNWNVASSYAYQTGHSKCIENSQSTYALSTCSHWKNDRWDTTYIVVINQNKYMVFGKQFFVTAGVNFEAQAIKDYFTAQKNNGTPVQVSTPLFEPVLVGTLTPTQIKTLVGANNIWANTNGNVDVKYWKH